MALENVKKEKWSCRQTSKSGSHQNLYKAIYKQIDGLYIYYFIIFIFSL